MRRENARLSEPARLLGLSPSEAILLSVLISRETLTRMSARVALYSLRPEADHPKSQSKIIDVFIKRIRERMRELDVRIETIWGVGWRIPKADKEKLKCLLAEQRDGNISSRICTHHR
jgi:DNA-binding response OmpR family regulator